jgi:hypothetical protein
MADETIDVLVLTDEAGDYYLIPRALIERCRVPAEQMAAVSEAVESAAGDTQGYVLGGIGSMGGVKGVNPGAGNIRAAFQVKTVFAAPLALAPAASQFAGDGGFGGGFVPQPHFEAIGQTERGLRD